MRTKGWIGAVVCGILFGLSACSNVTDGILSEKQMQQVLKDMLVAESMISVDYEHYKTDTSIVALYESVFGSMVLTKSCMIAH